MKKVLAALAMLAALALGSASPAFANQTNFAYGNNSNFNSIGVGFLGLNGNSNTYSVLTGAALTSAPPLDISMLQTSTFGYPSNSVITTNLYVAAATGLTNQAAVFFPAPSLQSTSAVLNFKVPNNYLTNGYLVADFHCSGATTANGVSIQATAYVNVPGSLTQTTAFVGPMLNLPLNTYQSLVPLALSSTPTTFTTTSIFAPNADVTYVINVKGTDAVTIQLLGLDFMYKPWGVFP